jgi:hypothetical protein
VSTDAPGRGSPLASEPLAPEPQPPEPLAPGGPVSEHPAPEPLAPGERPAALVVSIAVCIALAAAVLVGGLTIHDLSRHGGSLPGAIFLAGVFVSLANGMYRVRYWAVLGFEALLAFQILVTSLALVVASTITAALGCVVAITLAGTLFWKLVRVMARVQAAERADFGGER